MRVRLLIFILKAIAHLPLGVLYLFADVMFFLIYHLARYRRKVVDDNLAACFPEMSGAARAAVRRQFYRNFADYIVETVKLFHISDAEMSRRMVFENVEAIDRLTASGRSVAVYFSHCGNWEWAPSVTLHASSAPDIAYCQVYRPLRDKVFDAVMLAARSRFGSLSLPKATVLRSLVGLARNGKVTVTGFMSDQKPSHGDPTVPLMFLNRPTAFISGTETLAARLRMGAIYWDMHKTSRGHYRIDCRLLADDAAALPKGELTRRYAAALQQTITRNPAIWLWTHKRWKIPVTAPAMPL